MIVTPTPIRHPPPISTTEHMSTTPAPIPTPTLTATLTPTPTFTMTTSATNDDTFQAASLHPPSAHPTSQWDRAVTSLGRVRPGKDQKGMGSSPDQT